MAWLMVGPYPPSPDRAAARTLEFVKDRLRAGDDVRVMSPVPTAAHRHGNLVGASGIARLGVAARGADGLYLRLQLGIGPTPGAPATRALVEAHLLAWLLRSMPHSILDIGDLAPLPDRQARRLVIAAADEVVVETEEMSEQVLSAGAEPAKVRVVPCGEHRSWTDQRPLAMDGRGAASPPELPGGADRTTIERWVRERAARTSSHDAAVLVQADSGAAVSALPVLELRSPAHTVKGQVARVLALLTTWRLRPIVEHVNRLQHATVEALAARRGVDGRIGSDHDAKGPP